MLLLTDVIMSDIFGFLQSRSRNFVTFIKRLTHVCNLSKIGCYNSKHKFLCLEIRDIITRLLRIFPALKYSQIMNCGNFMRIITKEVFLMYLEKSLKTN